MDQRIGGAQSPQWLFVSGQTALITQNAFVGQELTPQKLEKGKAKSKRTRA